MAYQEATQPTTTMVGTEPDTGVRPNPDNDDAKEVDDDSKCLESLIEACKSGRLSEIEYCLGTVKKERINETLASSLGYAAIHCVAAYRGRTCENAIAALIGAGADPNLQSAELRETPLHLVLKNTRCKYPESTILTLLELGADPWIKNKALRTSYDEATTRGVASLIDILGSTHELLRDEDVMSIQDVISKYRKAYPRMFDREVNQLHLLCIDGTKNEIQRCILQDRAMLFRHNENGLLPIHVAVQRELDDTSEILDLLVEHKADVNGKTVVDGDTPLHIVVRLVGLQKAIELSKKLMSLGANTKSRNRNNMTPYDYAVVKGYHELAEILSSPLWLTDPMALVNAVCRGELDDIKTCIKKGADVNMKTEIGAAPIHYLMTHRVYQDKTEVLDVLTRSGLHINSVNRDWDTALTLAVSNFNDGKELCTLVSRLLDAECDNAMKNKEGKDALDIAKERNFADVVKLLEAANIKLIKKHLFKAVQIGDVKRVRELAEKDEAATPMFNEDGFHLLHVAVAETNEHDRGEMIRVLLDLGAKINIKSKREVDTPLHVAVKNNFPGVVLQLLENGADAAMTNREGKKPYDIAVELKYESCRAIFERRKAIREKWLKGANKAKNVSVASKSCTIL
ncbi:uncharacterized protein LOC141901993 [Tubulanus polymorphus]|uniref:uncharacterized protein LOC141901993 n=1 Tax=Tubulanus polymorphus TaxID=672921 RepID=UPI003DA554E6